MGVRILAGVVAGGAMVVLTAFSGALADPAIRPDGLPPQPLRVVVRIADDTDQKVMVRLRGHASDLPLTFIIADEPGHPAGLTEQIAAADALATREQAAAVVWFSYGRCGRGPATPATGTASDRLVVHIGQPRTRSVLARAVGRLSCDKAPPAAHASEDSAAFEAAAIVVRAALLAVADGGTIGVVPPSLAAPPPAAPPAAPPGFRPRIGVGWLWTMDGLTPHGQQGLQALVGVGDDRYGIEMGLLSTIPADVTDAFAAVSLSRAALTLGGAFRQPLGDRLALTAAVHAGVTLQMRTTTPLVAGVTPRGGSRIASAVVAPELRLAAAIPGTTGLTAGIALAADYIPNIPVLAYIVDNVRQDERRPWVVQPRASFNLQLRLP